MSTTTFPSPLLTAAGEHLQLLTEQDGWSRDELVRWQHDRVRDVVAHAVTRSAFYRAYLGADAPHRPLRALPPVGKAALMADPERVLTAPVPDDAVSLATGGSSRVRGTFHYTQEEWSWVLAAAMRVFRTIGVAPHERSAFVVADQADNMGAQVSRDLGAGGTSRRFDPSRPLTELCDDLEAFQPHIVGGYTSAAAVFAAEQLAGRLRIAPRAVMTSSEPRMPEVADRIRAAWGVEPFDLYATTEAGPTALDCDRHRGLHVNDGLVLLEVVDADDRPVAPGETGQRVLLTTLQRRLQPLIRYVLLDRVQVAAEPCPCGRPHMVIAGIEGRVDDMLMLPGPVHPVAFTPLAKLPGVREFQIVQRGDELHVTVVPTPGTNTDALARAAHQTTGEILARAKARASAIHVTTKERLERTAAGKLRLVRRES